MSNKFLSLDWFKNTAERAIEKVVASKLEQLMEEEQQVPKSTEKPYLNVKLINDTLTVVLTDGNVVSKPNATEEDFKAVTNAKDAMEIVNIVASSEVYGDLKQREAEAAKLKAIQKGIQTLAELDDFVVEGNTVYLSGTSRSMPQLLVERFIEIVDRVKYYKGFGFTQES